MKFERVASMNAARIPVRGFQIEDCEFHGGMEDGGVDRTVIDCRQKQLDKNGILSSSFNFLNF